MTAPEPQAGEIFAALLTDPSVRSTRAHVSLERVAEKYGNAAARALVAIGGSRRLAEMTEADEPVAARGFRDAFDGYASELADRAANAGRAARPQRPQRALPAVLNPMLPPRDR